jgi:hypothetical protein
MIIANGAFCVKRGAIAARLENSATENILSGELAGSVTTNFSVAPKTK